MAIERFTGEHAFLSNFFACPVQMLDISFRSSEHVFQAAKSVSPNVWAAVACLETPGEAKRFGHTIELRPNWERVKKQVMARVLLAKFLQNPDLAALLAATGNEMLVEGNHWHDNYWGRCTCARCVQRMVPAQNYLGRLLMATRDIVRED